MSENIALNTTLEKDLELDRISLKFKNTSIEEEFVKNYNTKNFKWVLYAGLLSVLVYTISDFADSLGDLNSVKFWFVKCTFVLPIIAASELILLLRKQLYQSIIILICMTIMLSFVFTSLISDKSGYFFYYTNILLTIIVLLNIYRINYRYTSLTIIFVYIFYHVLFLYMKGLNDSDFYRSLQLSVAISIISCIISYSQEFFIRSLYIQEILLKKEMKKSDFLMNEAISANKAKSEFLAVMSHELRTPLNAIVGFSEIMKDQLLGPQNMEKYKEYSKDIYESGIHLAKIIQDILDLSRTEIGTLKLHEETFQLAPVYNRCVRMLHEKAHEKNVNLEAEDLSEGISIIGDERLLSQVIINLLNNAIKFTPQGGKVTLSFVQDKDKSFGIRVTDTGIGIAEEDIPKVMMPFVQVESAWKREHNGAGIGLALVKNIIELHGGTLDIKSKLGQGTTVTSYLPIERLRVGVKN